MKSPDKGAGGTGGAKKSIPQVDHLVYSSSLAHSHVLTDAHGHYAALLCRDSGPVSYTHLTLPTKRIV